MLKYILDKLNAGFQYDYCTYSKQIDHSNMLTFIERSEIKQIITFKI